MSNQMASTYVEVGLIFTKIIENTLKQINFHGGDLEWLITKSLFERRFDVKGSLPYAQQFDRVVKNYIKELEEI